MSFNPATVRIISLDPLVDVAPQDDLVILDKSDLGTSLEGTEKRISARDLVEKTSVRPSTDLTQNQSLSDWLGQFSSDISGISEVTQQATTARLGVTRYATTQQARAKSVSTRAITPANLGQMDATQDLAGLVALAGVLAMADGQRDDVAVTPYDIFHGLLGESSIGNNSWVFKLPTRNVQGDVKLELVIQIGQVTYDTMQTQQNPETNFNHVHQTVQFDVDFPEDFPANALWVLPMPMEATPSQYTEGTDFWVRPYSVRRSGATFRATRLAGTSDGSEQAVCRYIAIGY